MNLVGLVLSTSTSYLPAWSSRIRTVMAYGMSTRGGGVFATAIVAPAASPSAATNGRSFASRISPERSQRRREPQRRDAGAPLDWGGMRHALSTVALAL